MGENVAYRCLPTLDYPRKFPHSQLDTKTYLGPGALLTQVTRAGRSHVASNPEEFPSQQLLDSAALRRAVAALLGQARAGAGFLGMSGSGRKVGGGAGTTAAAAWQWCDVVIVHGSQALDVDLLPPGAFGLGPAEALSAYVDTVPQVKLEARRAGASCDGERS